RIIILLVGTGFGKSQVVELSLLVFGTFRKVTSLILNLLDTLGDSQVDFGDGDLSESSWTMLKG
ncbi:hypothetical protein CROQUDRAFT_44081, partial [Cronartium quercuum f. sp. fusiforme G11]